MERRIFDVKLERNEWIKLNFIMAYTTKLVIWITLVGLGMLYVVVDYIFWNSYDTSQFPIAQLVFAIFILGVIPISTYVAAAKNINSNPWVSEQARYDIDLSQISIKGDSYQVSIDWTNIKSIKERRDWFVLLTDTNRGFFIPKRIFNSTDDLNGFRNDLNATPVKKKKLK